MALERIVTGEEIREFNGSVLLPVWNGTRPGNRNGDIAWNDTVIGDLSVGIIVWNGTEWINAGITDIPDLQAVTDVGSETDNDIMVSKSGDEDISQLISSYKGGAGTTSLQAFGAQLSGPASPYTPISQILMQGSVARIVVQTNVDLEIRNDSGTLLYLFSSGGNSIQYQNGVKDLTGSGSPEGVITAPISSTYRQLNGSPGAVLWVKQSDPTPNTGWAPIA